MALAAISFTLLTSGVARAQFYIGPSYLQVPGLDGGAKDKAHKNWLRAESRYWTKRPGLPEIRGIHSLKNDLLFTGPAAPAKGPDVLALAVDKASPGLKALMERCRRAERIPEVRFAESSELARHPQEHGPRPADVPEYYEYELTGVRLACPVVPAAPEQAFELHFEDIRWLNTRPQSEPLAITAAPAPLPPLTKSGRTKVFAISWFAAAADAKPDQCARMNSKPSQADYFTLMPADKAAALRRELEGKGGV
ncbi:MAG: hypothetical protein JF593_11105, partial [Novosphingobium sp.]|nr:hypothetical protein [Novosphingobium sp.]